MFNSLFRVAKIRNFFEATIGVGELAVFDFQRPT